MHSSHPPQPQPARGPSRGWWLLAGVSALASLLLFVSAVTNLMAARDAAVELARGSGLGLVREIRRELLRDPEGAQGIAQDLLQQLHDDGLRYLAWMAPPRRVLAQAGQALSTRDMQRPPRGGPRIERLAGGQRFLAVVPMGGPRHRRHRWRSSPRPPPRPGWMVIELEPVAAR